MRVYGWREYTESRKKFAGCIHPAFSGLRNDVATAALASVQGSKVLEERSNGGDVTRRHVTADWFTGRLTFASLFCGFIAISCCYLCYFLLSHLHWHVHWFFRSFSPVGKKLTERQRLIQTIWKYSFHGHYVR